MTFDEASKAALEGRHMMLPHWCWVYISGDQRGKLSLYEDDGSRRGAYRPTAAERRSEEWFDYADGQTATAA